MYHVVFAPAHLSASLSLCRGTLTGKLVASRKSVTRFLQMILGWQGRTSLWEEERCRTRPRAHSLEGGIPAGGLRLAQGHRGVCQAQGHPLCTPECSDTLGQYLRESILSFDASLQRVSVNSCEFCLVARDSTCHLPARGLLTDYRACC